MARIETARVKDVLGLQIGTVVEAAQQLTANGDVEALERGISEMERTIVELKEIVEALPHEHQQ